MVVAAYQSPKLVANAVAYYYDKVPENVQNLLFKLADNKNVAGAVADAVASNFKIPENTRNRLLRITDGK